jgi:hypothetical protein
MKDIMELETRLRAELDQWHVKQCRNNFDDYYLYYLETTAEHDGGIIICKEAPANQSYRLAMPQRIDKGATVNQNFNRIRNGILRSLPVLSY